VCAIGVKQILSKDANAANIMVGYFIPYTAVLPNPHAKVFANLREVLFVRKSTELIGMPYF